MRVLLVNDYSTMTGGAEMSVLRTRQALQDHDHDVALLASDRGPSAERRADYEFPALPSMSGLRGGFQQIWHPEAARILQKALEEFRPELVHLNSVWHLSLGALKHLEGVPTVMTVRTARIVCPVVDYTLPDGQICDAVGGLTCYRSGCVSLFRAVGELARQQALRRLLATVQLFICPSRALGNVVARAGYGPVRHIFNAMELWEPPERSDRPAVVYVGRLAREKGIFVLLSAMEAVVERIPEAHLYYVGDGDARSALEDEIDRRDLTEHVDCLGWVANERLPEVHGLAQVAVVPSIWFEALGNTVFEAFASELPAIGADVGGIPEMIEDGVSGYVVVPGDSQQLADRICHLLEDPERSLQMGREGRRFAEQQCALDVYYERLMEAYTFARARAR